MNLNSDSYINDELCICIPRDDIARNCQKLKNDITATPDLDTDGNKIQIFINYYIFKWVTI